MRDNPSLRQLVICHAPADAETALRLADFFEANLPFRVAREEGVVTADLDLIDTVEIALSAEAVLVLLSPDSVPAKWERARWEPVFVQEQAELGCQLGFVLMRACAFPELFRRRPFFDLTGDFVPVARRLNQWLLDPERPITKTESMDSGIADLRVRLADRPGIAVDLSDADTSSFIDACARDFHAVHRIDCSDRTPAGIFGQIGRVLGLRLPGTTEDSRGDVARYCESNRDLLVFQNLSQDQRELVSFGGKASTIFVAPESRVEVAANTVCESFFGWPRDLERCADLLGAAYAHLPALLANDYETGKRLGWAVLALLRNWERNTEAAEFLDLMLPAAQANADQQALFRIERELCWLRDTPFTDAPADPGPLQMSLFSAA